jgi:hypothetical protein
MLARTVRGCHDGGAAGSVAGVGVCEGVVEGVDEGDGGDLVSGDTGSGMSPNPRGDGLPEMSGGGIESPPLPVLDGQPAPFDAPEPRAEVI